MLQNAYLLAKIGADTAENERSFAENLPKIGNSQSRQVVEPHLAVQKVALASGRPQNAEADNCAAMLTKSF